MDTVDNPADGLRVITLSAADQEGYLGTLLDATKRIRKLDIASGDDRAISEHAIAQHRPGTRTLIVVNTVRSATAIYGPLQRLEPIPLGSSGGLTIARAHF